MSKSPADDWRYIPDFPLYMINGEWEVRNTRTGQVMRPSTDGNWTVYLYDAEHKQHHRSVRPLFYSAFPERKPGYKSKEK